MPLSTSHTMPWISPPLPRHPCGERRGAAALRLHLSAVNTIPQLGGTPDGGPTSPPPSGSFFTVSAGFFPLSLPQTPRRKASLLRRRGIFTLCPLVTSLPCQRTIAPLTRQEARKLSPGAFAFTRHLARGNISLPRRTLAMSSTQVTPG